MKIIGMTWLGENIHPHSEKEFIVIILFLWCNQEAIDAIWFSFTGFLNTVQEQRDQVFFLANVATNWLLYSYPISIDFCFFCWWDFTKKKKRYFGVVHPKKMLLKCHYYKIRRWTNVKFIHSQQTYIYSQYEKVPLYPWYIHIYYFEFSYFVL